MWENPELWLGILAAIVVAVGFGWKWLKGKWDWISKYPELLALAEGAATETYHEYVREIKAASDDGKLTSEEKKHAMDVAVKKFLAHAKDNGVEVAKSLALPIIKSLVEKAVSRLKSSDDK